MPRSKHKLGLLGVFFLENNILLRRPRFLLTYSVALCVTYSNRKRRQRGVAKTEQCIFGQDRTEPKLFPFFKFSFPSDPQLPFRQTAETGITLTYYALPAPPLTPFSVALQ